MLTPKNQNLDLFPAQEAAEARDARPLPPASSYIAPTNESTLEEWRLQPNECFVKWARSQHANEGKGFSERSLITYTSMWGKFVKFCPSNPALADAAKIEAFLATLEGRVRNAKVKDARPSPFGSRRRYLSLLSKLQDFMVRTGVRKQNDAKALLFELDKVVHSQVRPLPIALLPEEEKSLKSVVSSWPSDQWRDCRDKALLAVLIGSGIKVTEARGLKVSEVRIEGDLPYIRIASGRQERLAPIADSSLPDLSVWLSRRLVLFPLGELVFPGDDKPMLSASTMYRIVASAIKQADLNPMHTGPSVLRHTFATRQIREGRTVAQVSAWLGHKQEISSAIYKFMVIDPDGARPV